MKKSQVAMAVAAAFGTGAASAASVPVVLVGTVTQSGNGPSTAIVSNSTATWMYDTVTGVVTGSGLYKEQTQIAPTLPGQLFTHNVVNIAVGGGGAASATSYACIEGSFGNAVFASLCGNYNFGANYVNESTVSYGPGTAFSKSVLGDDVDLGTQQNLTQYDGGTTTEVGDDVIVSNAVPMVSGATITFTRPGDAADDNFPLPQGSAGVTLAIGANDVRWTAGSGNNVTGPATGDQGGSFAINLDPNITNVTVTYSPVNGAFTGTETWTYTVADSATSGPLVGWTDMGTVTVNVSPLGASDDAAATARLTESVVIPTGANDFGFTDPSTVTVISGPAQGTATVTGSPGPTTGVTIEYATTAPLFSAPFTDTFTYRVTDAGASTDTAVVTVQVNNTVPVAGDLGGVTLDTQGVSPSTVSVDIDVGPVGAIAGNALGDAASVVTTGPANDVTTTVSGTVVTVQAAAFASAGDAVGYTITDADGESDTGTIALTIPDAVPTVGSASETIEFPGVTPIAVSQTLGNGAAGDHTVTVSAPRFGTVSNVAIDAATGMINFDYTPSGFAGPEVLTVELRDGDGSTASGTVTITMTGLAITIPPQDSLPGNSSALGPAGLGMLFGIPWLRRRRRKR